MRVTLTPRSEMKHSWEPLPYRFERLSADEVLVTNMVGEHVILDSRQFAGLGDRTLTDPDTIALLRARHIVRRPSEALPIELLALKTLTRQRRLPELTGLHIFVVTLRCEHACPYCQVSRQNSARDQFDMSPEVAAKALESTFSSPSATIKIEFQGGEPLLNLPLVEQITRSAMELRGDREKDVQFVVATNLALLDDAALEFARWSGAYFSTSLDGPKDLHNANRPRPGGNSWELAVAGIRRIQEDLGVDRVSALMTTTEASLSRARDIVDTYVSLGLRSVFLRPISPYGFAVRTRAHSAYGVERWLEFYEEGLDYILELDQQGIQVEEHFASVILRKMLTNDDPGYVDLTSPAGIGVGALVYNYDGDVYASDEGRMLAEMGDKTFRIGNIHTSCFEELVTSEVVLAPLEESFALSSPMCTDCAFECYCGSDPVFHHATTGDYLGKKPLSPFCQRNMGVFKLLLERYHRDPHARDAFRRWAAQ